MTHQVHQWVQHCLDTYPISGNVLEVGSMDICGSPKRHFRHSDQEFTKVSEAELLARFPVYVGVDMLPGNGVDKVVNSHHLIEHLPVNYYDVVVSTEMLEHDDRPWDSMMQMYYMLKEGGWVIITTCGIHAEEHSFPSDYYRFLPNGLRVLMEWAGFEVLETMDCKEAQGTYAVGRKL